MDRCHSEKEDHWFIVSSDLGPCRERADWEIIQVCIPLGLCP